MKFIIYQKIMHEAHDALMCIGKKTYINDQKRLKLSDQSLFKNYQMK